MSLKIKICGMNNANNIQEIADLQPDYLGFIFYTGSPRYCGHLDSHILINLNNHIEKVAVFVNETLEEIQRIISKYHIQTVQLHGNELPEFCDNLRQKKIKVIKAFGIDKNFNYNTLKQYKETIDFILFDTKSTQHGGSGQSFDWELLNKKYTLSHPFFIGGGVGTENLNDLISKTKNLPLYAVDLNSKLELSPGIKNVQKVKQAIEIIKGNN